MILTHPLRLLGKSGNPAQQCGPGDDSVERIAEIVREHAHVRVLPSRDCIRLGELLLLLQQQRRAALELEPLFVQRQQIAHLAAQDVGVDRLDQIVDCAELVGAPHGTVVPGAGHEDHRRGAPQLASQELDGLEAIAGGHPDVDQQQRKLAPGQQPDRVRPRGGFDELVTERFQDRAVGNQVSGRVIDEEQRQSRR